MLKEDATKTLLETREKLHLLAFNVNEIVKIVCEKAVNHQEHVNKINLEFKTLIEKTIEFLQEHISETQYLNLTYIKTLNETHQKLSMGENRS